MKMDPFFSPFPCLDFALRPYSSSHHRDRVYFPTLESELAMDLL